MTTELSRKNTETTRDDKNVSEDTLTKKHPVKNDKSHKYWQSIGNSPQLQALKVVLPILEATNIAPLPGGVGFSVQPLSATINPLNKTRVPGVGNYPARKSKRNTVELSCCYGCTAGVACKRAKSSGAQHGHKHDKNIAKKRKYVKTKYDGTRKHQSGTRSGSREMLNLSMVHQYRFNPQTPVRGVSSDKQAPAKKPHLPRGLVNDPVVGTTKGISSTSSTVCSTSVASGNSLPMTNISTCPLGGTARLRTAPTHFPNPPAINTNTGVASLQQSHFPNAPAINTNTGVASSQQAHFPNPPAINTNTGVASSQQAHFPNAPAINTNTGVASLQQAHFPLLPPLPLQQPLVTAIPVYASPNLCPFYMPPEAVQPGMPIMPQRPPIYSLMRYCSLPVENNCGQVLTDLAYGGTILPCLNSASFELQTQGRNDNVSTCSTSIGHPEDHVAACSTSVGHQINHIGISSTSSTSNRLQRGHVGTSTSTIVGHQSNNEALFSISSLLPEMSSESESTGNSAPQGAMQFAGKGKFKAFCPSWRDLKTLLGRVSERDVTDYRWLADQTCESPATISSIPSLKNLIGITELKLDDENDQLLKSCAKLEHLINTYRGNISRDTEKYEKVTKQLHAAQKRGVSQMEAEMNDVLTKMKFLFDDMEMLEKKWYNRDGTLLVANSIFKQNITSYGS